MIRSRIRPRVVSGFVLPHAPYVCLKEDWDYYLARVTLPRVPAGYVDRVHPAIKHWRKVRGLDEATDDEIITAACRLRKVGA